MFSARWIRENGAAFDAGLARRGVETHAAQVQELDAQRRAVQTEFQDCQRKRNRKSKGIGAARAQGEDVSDLLAEVTGLKDAAQALEREEKSLAAGLDGLLAGLPNLPDDDVPDGADESTNVEIRRWGEQAYVEGGARQHFEIGEALGLMDFERAAKLSGSRFVVLSGALARLERALAAFMLDMHTTEYGYTETAPPLLVRDAAAFGTGNLPKFEEDLFHTTDGYWLIPTAEMPLTNLVAGEILEEDALPLRFTAYTPCFRAEAGAAGKDTRGMLRQHQFSKVELVSVTRPEDSEAEHERMTACAEEVLKRLGLAYRVVVLSTGDMGFAARKTYDIEVWLPGQGRYREISSCSNCGDFQARRMNARYRRAGERQTHFVHTLNGSALAVGRTLVAVLEAYQQEGGGVTVPEALRPYLRRHGGDRLMRILVCNDDGIDAPGIKVLERVARGLSKDVWVVAPETQQSAASHSLTLHRPLRLRKISRRRYAVNGTPTDCVFLAFNKILADGLPDLVLSGVNDGPNVGEDVTYSGTIAAAMEATLFGAPAVAFSQAYGDGRKHQWATAEQWAGRLLPMLIERGWPARVLINVNFPDLAAADVRGIRVVRQGLHALDDTLEERIDPRGAPYYWIGAQLPATGSGQRGTDMSAIDEGYVSVTPLHMDLTHRRTLTWLREVIE